MCLFCVVFSLFMCLCGGGKEASVGVKPRLCFLPPTFFFMWTTKYAIEVGKETKKRRRRRRRRKKKKKNKEKESPKYLI